jgi:hypothetical protein
MQDKKSLEKKWKNVSYEQIKRSKKLQDEYRKDYNLDFFNENEKIYNPEVQYNQNVLLPENDDINAFKGKLLNEIWGESYTNNFGKEFLGLDGVERSIIMGKMTGFSFKEISVKSGIDVKLVKQAFLKGIQKIIDQNRNTCRDCKFRTQAFKVKRDQCIIWKVKVRKDSYCWLYKKE